MDLIAAVSVATLISLAIACTIFSCGEAKVLTVLMEGDAVVSFTDKPRHLMSEGDVKAYKENITSAHDGFLRSVLPAKSYTKLYSYTHLLNGFALHTSSDEALKSLREAKGVRSVLEDAKVQKTTTHTPDYLGLPGLVWPQLGGGPRAGDGVVVGLVDTGINPRHPSFADVRGGGAFSNGRFKGRCEAAGRGFPSGSCNGKLVGARFFVRAAIADGDFNATLDYASPFDADGHGSHVASIAAGNHNVPVLVNGFNFGNSSGMAPGAKIAVYKAMYSNGGYMSDIVAAIDQAAEDGVDVLSLSFGTSSSVPPGLSSFLNVLDVELLMAAKAGIFVAQSVGNDGPSSSSVRSFGPWITSVAASTTDRKYNNSIVLGNGLSLPGTGLSPPTGAGERLFSVAAAADVSVRNASLVSVEDCQSKDLFIRQLARGKLILCTYGFDDDDDDAGKAAFSRIATNVRAIGAAGFIVTVDPNSEAQHYKGSTMIMPVPGIVLNNLQSSRAIWDYYNSNTVRRPNGATFFMARSRILDGRRAVYSGRGLAVASYSSRGPDVNNMRLETADVLKPNVMAPGSSIWAASSPISRGNPFTRGQSFALLSGTSMAASHIAGIAALIKQKHPNWSPAAVASAMMTTANVTDAFGSPILAHGATKLVPATPFDYGAGFVDPARAVDPGLVFDIEPSQYVQFLCAVDPRVDEGAVRSAVGTGCPNSGMKWPSDLNTPSVTVANLLGSRRVVRRVTNVGGRERYQVFVREPEAATVTVSPRVFSLNPNETRKVSIVLEAVKSTNGFSFGEVLFMGDKKHQVRVPLAVYVTSSL